MNGKTTQQWKSLFIKGINIGALPVVSIHLVIALIFSLYLNEIEPSWDFTRSDAISKIIFDAFFFTLITFFGIAILAWVLSRFKKRLSGKSANILGFITGIFLILVATIGTYVILRIVTLVSYDYDVSFLDFFIPALKIYMSPGLATMLLLGYLSNRMNDNLLSQPEINSDIAPKQEIRGELWGAITAVRSAGIAGTIHLILNTIYRLKFGGSPFPYNEVIVTITGFAYVFPIILAAVFVIGLLISAGIRRAKNHSFLTMRRSIVYGMLVGLLFMTGYYLASYSLECAIFDYGSCNIEVIFSYSTNYFQCALGIAIGAIAGALVGKRLYFLDVKPSIVE